MNTVEITRTEQNTLQPGNLYLRDGDKFMLVQYEQEWFLVDLKSGLLFTEPKDIDVMQYLLTNGEFTRTFDTVTIIP